MLLRSVRLPGYRARLSSTTNLQFNHAGSDSATSRRPSFNREPAFRFTQPPSLEGEWRVGGGPNGLLDKSSLNGSYKTWVMAQTPPKDGYRILTSAIVPRPIAFVSSLSLDGVPNLAPFSYFSMVSHNPPMLSVSFSLSPRRPKDTRENILATKEFTVNIISEDFVEAANATSVEAPADVDEWLISGLTMEPSEYVKPARVRECAVSFECKLYTSLDIPTPADLTIGTTLILGKIQLIHVRESVLAEDGITVDPRKLRAVSRLGGTTYGRIGEGFELPRPSWKTMRGSYDTLTRTHDSMKE